MQQVEANRAEAGHLGPASPCMGLSWSGSRSQKGRQTQASQGTLKMSFKTSSTMQSSSAAFHEGRMQSGEVVGGGCAWLVKCKCPRQGASYSPAQG